MHNSILCFSISGKRVIATSFPHPSSPTILAVSKESKTLLTASETPQILYLHKLQRLTAPQILHPQASSAPVTSAAFHPDRDNVFLLCFQDGSVAAYDIAKFQTRDSHFEDTCKYEYGHIKKIHSPFTRWKREELISRSILEANLKTQISDDKIGRILRPIASAAFVAGYRNRAVTVGYDGRCRLIDFGGGGKLLRTWSLGAPATCLSILETGENTQARARFRGHIITVGTLKGNILFYNSVGLLLHEVKVTKEGERVVGLDWSEHCIPDDMPDIRDCISEKTTVDISVPSELLTADSFIETDTSQKSGYTNVRATNEKSIRSFRLRNECYPKTVVAKGIKNASGFDGLRSPFPDRMKDLFSSVREPAPHRNGYRARPRLTNLTFRRDSSLRGKGTTNRRRQTSSNQANLSNFSSFSQERSMPLSKEAKNDQKGQGQQNILSDRTPYSGWDKDHIEPVSYFSSDTSSINSSISAYEELSKNSGNLELDIQSNGSYRSKNLDNSHVSKVLKESDHKFNTASLDLQVDNSESNFSRNEHEEKIDVSNKHFSTYLRNEVFCCRERGSESLSSNSKDVSSESKQYRTVNSLSPENVRLIEPEKLREDSNPRQHNIADETSGLLGKDKCNYCLGGKLRCCDSLKEQMQQLQGGIEVLLKKANSMYDLLDYYLKEDTEY